MTHLTKSHFISGCQCHDLLWWRTHAAEAPEVEPDLALEDRFEQGREVGRRAWEYVPGGVLIDRAGGSEEGRVEKTQAALAEGAPVVYEAAFLADGVFVSVDILERTGDDFHLIEVKSSTKAKEEHIPDVAVQMHVLGRSGLEVRRAEVMHLNPDCRYPDLGDLFVRADVTQAVLEFLPQVPGEIEEQLRVIRGEQPGVGFGEHCLTARACPFGEHCWPERTADHVLTLYRVRAAQKWEMLERGIESMHDIDDPAGLPRLARRQVQAVQQGQRIIDPGLGQELERFRGPLALLDFETVGLAIPAWEGCGPWEAMPVQFSCHQEAEPGRFEHRGFLAASGEDCRAELARALIEACGGGRTVVAYNASFERGCLRHLARAVPELAGDLGAIEARLEDPLPVVRDSVYDPAFKGSFSLKSVLPALVPELSYDDLEVAEGQVASLWLRRLLFQPEVVPAAEREGLRRDLEAYCERDTWATVKLIEKLRELAALEL